MAAKKPVTLLQFNNVSGVGSYKSERYSVIFIEKIKDYKEIKSEGESI